MRPAVRTGNHYITGDVACAEGAIAAGCRFFGAYPITPATEVAEHMAQRLPDVGGTFLQMEDEIAAIASILGASWTGTKTMTATSGPGFSLMMENLGLGVCTETPCVIVNVQRTGPSTGLPTQTGQGDMMQARWGSHGDYELIAIAPSSPQDCFYHTILAFNLSEKYRVPVLVMADEIVGHMSEKVVIPDAREITLVSRPKPKGRKDRFRLYEPGPDGVAPMPAIGEGYNVHVTGLTHDERGYPVMTPECQEQMMARLKGKIRDNLDDIIHTEEYLMDDADIVIVSYGISVRTSLTAVDELRRLGYKVGLLRLITVWPFPEQMIHDIAACVRGLITVEINLGQVHYEVERCAHGQAETHLVGAAGGKIIHPDEVVSLIKEVFEP